ncbi:N(6)-adenine-specific DNA methyltransferase METTL4 [Phoca vitulina]|uniref:N(6)-adenine-specific DNA methyltransferase METTL4 n=1 Tax=Phoca vitulina TaxID=9720 RepID=UPI001395FA29|nr:N(6)-adenine-specific DNA methyltransferase METTL4 [Phoca vitulina]XP_032277236.1 N(6)-adenine-specific DNA methyltransferase METTL4 [Phoca vitulina]XP_032277237.1 N(6)-adenine-specific DNA methyltransferase METTL4 [Phoca vitulina]XP_032277238.1 N(6)-adenine-specific DNA methyltransferase METTL4 [Phoca vitulina]XP_032277239.1 N(6)-adenine-specific DNA methyltransferase METTL4 [Phoca vitulina]XP_032277240.1 N(6)-adenine-specific DNA methyltransferase METTL4 [Phoca vitulina]
MSVVHQLSPGWLLDHLSFINNINYQLHQHHEPCCSKNEPTSSVHFDTLQMDSLISLGTSATFIAFDSTTKPDNDARGNCEIFIQRYVFRSELFNVTKPYITPAVHKECQQRNEKEDPMDGIKEENRISIIGKKRKRCVVFNQGELDAMEYHTKIRGLILDGSSELIQEGLKSGFLHPLSEKWDKCSEPITLPLDTCSLSELCTMAKHLPSLNAVDLQALQLMEEDMSITEQDLFSRVVENNSSFTKMITLMGQKYLVPPKSSFLLSDISCMHPLLNCRKTYDVIVMDPPWQNKSVKRSNRYSYLSPLQIKQIPIPKLAAPNCLIITWVTNRQKHLRFVKEELYPSWSVEIVAEWHWVKITNSGEFVFPLDSPHKKPYEGLILGRVREKTAVPLRNEDVKVLPIPDHKLIVSVPCTLHSHKPPLAEILKDYIKPDGECLELFARNLQPGWTSWGNEVLKFQHMDYFVALQSRS